MTFALRLGQQLFVIYGIQLIPWITLITPHFGVSLIFLYATNEFCRCNPKWVKYSIKREFRRCFTHQLHWIWFWFNTFETVYDTQFSNVCTLFLNHFPYHWCVKCDVQTISIYLGKHIQIHISSIHCRVHFLFNVWWFWHLIAQFH